MFEYLIVTVLVLWSTIVVFKKVFPQTAIAICVKLSNTCEQLGWTNLAKWLKPKVATGCGGGCGCAIDEKNDHKGNDAVQTVKWR